MNLHSIGATHQALVWMIPTGHNGQPIGRAEDKGYHLYPVDRGTPNAPVGSTYRRWWNPWGDFPTVDPKTPICGQIRSTARNPYLQDWGGYNGRCAACAAIATAGRLVTGTRGELLATDPWAAIPERDRPTTPDPVTGL